MEAMNKIHYRKRRSYKYTLDDGYWIETEFRTGCDLACSDMISLSAAGLLRIAAGYAWDGPSGIAIDTKNFMRGSLVHDALYQLMREGLLSREHRDAVDRLLEKICLEDGMSKLRAAWVYQAVKRFGAKAAEPDVLEAP